jgi:hypothetical protein
MSFSAGNPQRTQSPKTLANILLNTMKPIATRTVFRIMVFLGATLAKRFANMCFT